MITPIVCISPGYLLVQSLLPGINLQSANSLLFALIVGKTPIQLSYSTQTTARRCSRCVVAPGKSWLEPTTIEVIFYHIARTILVRISCCHCFSSAGAHVNLVDGTWRFDERIVAGEGEDADEDESALNLTRNAPRLVVVCPVPSSLRCVKGYSQLIVLSLLTELLGLRFGQLCTHNFCQLLTKEKVLVLRDGLRAASKHAC